MRFVEDDRRDALEVNPCRCTLTSMKWVFRFRRAAEAGDGVDKYLGISQQRASLPKRLEYLTFQTGPSVAISDDPFGYVNRALDRTVMLENECPPQLAASTSLGNQC